MASFTDTKGDRWEVPFTIRQVLRIRQVLGIDIAQAGAAKEPMAELRALLGDPEKDLIGCFERMVNVLFVCCERQVRERELSDVDFAERMDLQTFGDALDAFTAGFVDFFLKGPMKDRARRAMEQRTAKLGRRVETEEAKLVASLESSASASS